MTKTAGKWLKSLPNLWPKRLKNHTLWGRPYLYSPYKGVPHRAFAIQPRFHAMRTTVCPNKNLDEGKWRGQAILPGRNSCMLNITQTIDRSFYRFIGAINHLECCETLEKQAFARYSKLFSSSQESCIVTCGGKPIENVVACLVRMAQTVSSGWILMRHYDHLITWSYNHGIKKLKLKPIIGEHVVFMTH